MTQVRAYRREADGRLVAGVCRGLATHLRLDPFVVRLAFCLLSLAHGIGVVAYLAFWVVVPAAPGQAGGSAAGEPAAPAREWPRILAFGSLALGGFLALAGLGWIPALAAWPVVLVGLGAALVWQQADEAEREGWRAGGRRFAAARRLWPRLLLGAVLVLVGIQGFTFAQAEPGTAGAQLLSTLAWVTGLAIVFAPWWLHMEIGRAHV